MAFKLSPTAPTGWGNDELTAYLDNLRQNQYATFVQNPLAADLITVDRVLRTLLTDVSDPDPPFPLQFMIRAHSIQLAATSACMAGQSYECSVLLRASLEAAAYGVYIGSEDSKAALWLSRDDTKPVKNNVRNGFSVGKIKRHLNENHADLGRTFEVLYDTSIAYGAHPNVRAFSSNMSVRQEGDMEVIRTAYLHGKGRRLDFAIKATIQHGIWNALAFEALYPRWYREKGVASEIDELRTRY